MKGKLSFKTQFSLALALLRSFLSQQTRQATLLFQTYCLTFFFLLQGGEVRRRNKSAVSRADSAETELCEWNGKGNGIPNLVKPFELSICIWSWLCNRNETFYGCTDNVEKLFLHYVRLVDRENLKPKQKGMKRNKRRKTERRFNTFFSKKRFKFFSCILSPRSVHLPSTNAFGCFNFSFFSTQP